MVQFSHVANRNAVLEKAKRKKITCSDLQLRSGSVVYVNEPLCPTIKCIFGATVAKKEECGWRYAWTKNGKIFASKTETSSVVQIAYAENTLRIVA